MLRRYWSDGLQSIPLSRAATTIGSADCHIVIPDDRLAPQHAIIEFNPISKTYWLKDVGSLSGTVCNGEPVYSKTKLNSGDVIRFGYGPEFVFEMNSTPELIKKRFHHCTACHSTSSLSVVGQDNFGNPEQGSEKLGVPIFSTADDRRVFPLQTSRRESLSIDESPPPIVQHPKQKVRIEQRVTATNDDQQKLPPKPNTRPISGLTRRAKLKQSVSPEMRKILASAQNVDSTRNDDDFNAPPPSDSSSNLGEIPEIKKKHYTCRSERLRQNPDASTWESTNNSLLQRLVQLQVELVKRDGEIMKLKKALTTNLNVAGQPNIRSGSIDSSWSLMPSNRTHHLPQLDRYTRKLGRSNTSVDLDFYRTILEVVRYELTSLSHKMSACPMKDYAEVFNAIVYALQEPLSYKLMDIENKCRDMLESKGYNEQQLERLHALFTEPSNEQIQPIIHQLEQILPVVRDAATIARESVRVCAIFTAWSRELGDRIRTDGLTSETLMQYADELHVRFGERFLASHWLPPSLIPLLRVSAIALRRHLEEKPLQKSHAAVNTDITTGHMKVFGNELNSMKNMNTEEIASGGGCRKNDNGYETKPLKETVEVLREKIHFLEHELQSCKSALVEKMKRESSPSVKAKEPGGESDTSIRAINEMEGSEIEGTNSDEDRDRDIVQEDDPYKEASTEPADSEPLDLEEENVNIEEVNCGSGRNRITKSILCVPDRHDDENIRNIVDETVASSAESDLNGKLKSGYVNSVNEGLNKEVTDNEQLLAQALTAKDDNLKSAETVQENATIKMQKLKEKGGTCSNLNDEKSFKKTVSYEQLDDSLNSDVSPIRKALNEKSSGTIEKTHAISMQDIWNDISSTIPQECDPFESNDSMDREPVSHGRPFSSTGRDSAYIGGLHFAQMDNNSPGSSAGDTGIAVQEARNEDDGVNHSEWDSSTQDSSVDSVYSDVPEVNESNNSNGPIGGIPEASESSFSKPTPINTSELNSDTVSSGRQSVSRFNDSCGGNDDKVGSPDRISKVCASTVKDLLLQRKNSNRGEVSGREGETADDQGRDDSEAESLPDTARRVVKQADLAGDDSSSKNTENRSSDAIRTNAQLTNSGNVEEDSREIGTGEHKDDGTKDDSPHPFEDAVSMTKEEQKNQSEVSIGAGLPANKSDHSDERIQEYARPVRPLSREQLGSTERTKVTEQNNGDVENQEGRYEAGNSEQQLEALLESISKFLGRRSATNRRDANEIPTVAADNANREHKLEELLSRIGQLGGDKIFCETCHRMKERDHSSRSSPYKGNGSFWFLNEFFQKCFQGSLF
ncbi:hypothetical protein Tcan_12741 [Toxocara canis]|uniref:FHA domain-containing protein n=1 Tax=Toxocara canis TaxID=6265 RepID=A0A0B2VU18_TOXCA|nr:hypothetical protein Tcan_12741 [Toxocara canis]